MFRLRRSRGVAIGGFQPHPQRHHSRRCRKLPAPRSAVPRQEPPCVRPGSGTRRRRDEPGIVVTVRDRLRSEGYEVTVRDDGAAGFEAALAGGYDLTLLDLMLPGMDGLDMCRDLRARGIDTPIIMVTAKSQIVDRVLGLKLGADDYLLKPFDFMELSARIEAVLRRRSGIATEESVRFGPFVLELQAKQLRLGDELVALSFQEYKLLEFFVRNRNRVLSRDELLEAVWGFQHTPTTRTVDVHVAWLRQKLRGNTEEYIQTVRKHGYRFIG